MIHVAPIYRCDSCSHAPVCKFKSEVEQPIPNNTNVPKYTNGICQYYERKTTLTYSSNIFGDTK